MKILTTFGLFLALLIPGLIRAETYYIPDDFPTISDAYSAVTAIDTICLREGNFHDNISIGSKDITILSESGSEYSYLRPLDSLVPVIHGFGEELPLGAVYIRGITFDSTVVTPAIELTRLSAPGLVVDSCRFLDNSSSLIIKLRESDFDMTNCLMRDNSGNLLDLFSFESAGEIIMRSNSFVANDGQVLFRLYGNDCYLHDNIFDLNDCDTCCIFDADGLLTVDSCRWSQNSASALLCLDYCQAGVKVYANSFIGNSSLSILAAKTSGGIYRKNLFEDNQDANILSLTGPVSLTRIDSNTFTTNQVTAQANLVHIDCGANDEDIVVSDNIFEDNSSDSGAIVYFRAGGFCDQDVLGNKFRYNTSGGSSILRLITGAGDVCANVFDSNQVAYGAIISFDSYPMFGVPSFDENILACNIIDSGYAVVWLNSCREDCVFKNNLLYKNIFYADFGNALAVTNPGKAIVCTNNLVAQNYNCSGISLAPDPNYTDSIKCNNSWGHADSDYSGFSPDSTNLSCDPMFCDPGPGQYSVTDQSCCLPDNNLCADVIGPVEAGCLFAQITEINIEDEPSLMNVIEHQPVFTWSDSSYTGFSQTRYEIEIGEDSNWQVAELWDPPVTYSTNSLADYEGSPLSDGQACCLRLRIGDDSNWSDWCQISFRMNSLPGIPQPLNPLDSAITGTQPELYLLNSGDPDGDTLLYEFIIFDDLDQIVIESPLVTQAIDSTSWICTQALEEDQRYHWQARSYDGYERSSWSDKKTFFVNSVNTAPEMFDLIFPPDSNNIPLADLNPVFKWTCALDPDPLDTVSYTVYLSEDSSFNQVVQYSDYTDTFAVLPDSLKPASHYWWKVRAVDLLQNESWSVNSMDFFTIQCGDVNLDRAVEISDAVYIINYIFLGGGEPSPLQSADVNCDSSADLSDAFYIINFIFMSGSPPCDLDSDGEFDC